MFVPGKPPAPVTLARDYSPKDVENMKVELVTDPPQPIAHTKTMMFFKVTPAEGLEKLLGAWGHMLAASDDLVDLIHTHHVPGRWRPKHPVQCDFPARAYV